MNIKELRMKKFIETNKEIINNPLMKSFLENEENYKLVQEAISNSTDENKKKVDNTFKSHYDRAKLISYVSKLIHFFSIDYDKKVNRLNKRYLLTLDKSVSSDTDNEITLKELVESNNHLSFTTAYGSTLKDQIENTKLIVALEKLTPKQLKILELIYIENLAIKDIAVLLNTSPQNISNQHRKSIKKLKEELI